MTQQRTGRFTRRRQPKGLIGRVQQVILRPVGFFEYLPQVEDSRHWLMIGVLILGLIGYSAVRQSSTDPLAAAQSDALVVGLQAILPMLLAWLSLTILLGMVSMLRGRAPEFGLNLRVAIWSSLPFGVLATLQLIRLFSGYEIGEVGLSGLFTNAQGWDNFDITLQAVILQTMKHLTIFGVWQTILLWIGARQSLRGSRLAVMLMLIIWICALILIPTGFEIYTSDATSIDIPDVTPRAPIGIEGTPSLPDLNGGTGTPVGTP